jgi:hypothetical protein
MQSIAEKCNFQLTLEHSATVGMIVAQIIRRTQLIERGIPDPFPIIGWQYSHAMDGDKEGISPIMAPELVRGLEEEAEKNSQTKSLLRLVYVLEKGKLLLLAIGIITSPKTWRYLSLL